MYSRRGTSAFLRAFSPTRRELVTLPLHHFGKTHAFNTCLSRLLTIDRIWDITSRTCKSFSSDSHNNEESAMNYLVKPLDGTDPAISPDDLKLAVNEVKNSNDISSFSDVPGSEKGGRKLAIIYTCKVCETRSAKKFTEHAYQNGLVMVRCPGCENLHLIADRLGVFDDSKGGWDIEKYLNKMGERVQTVTKDNVLEVTMADVLGK